MEKKRAIYPLVTSENNYIFQEKTKQNTFLMIILPKRKIKKSCIIYILIAK